MKNSPVPAILMAILACSALGSVVLCLAVGSNSSELSLLQAQASTINNTRTIMNAVAAETLEYSKTHPAIDPILEEAKLKAPSHPQSAVPSKTTK